MEVFLPAFQELGESLLAGATPGEGPQRHNLTTQPLPSLFPLLPSVTMESKAQVRPLGSIHLPRPRGPAQALPAGSPRKSDSLGRSVVALSERELSLAAPVTVLREATSSPGGRLPERGGRQGERPGLVPIPVSLLGREGFL